MHANSSLDDWPGINEELYTQDPENPRRQYPVSKTYLTRPMQSMGKFLLMNNLFPSLGLNLHILKMEADRKLTCKTSKVPSNM